MARRSVARNARAGVEVSARKVAARYLIVGDRAAGDGCEIGAQAIGVERKPEWVWTPKHPGGLLVPDAVVVTWEAPKGRYFVGRETTRVVAYHADYELDLG